MSILATRRDPLRAYNFIVTFVDASSQLSVTLLRLMGGHLHGHRVEMAIVALRVRTQQCFELIAVRHDHPIVPHSGGSAQPPSRKGRCPGFQSLASCGSIRGFSSVRQGLTG